MAFTRKTYGSSNGINQQPTSGIGSVSQASQQTRKGLVPVNQGSQPPWGTTGVTPYQANMAQPAQPDKWYAGEQPTNMEMLGRGVSLYGQDPVAGAEFIGQYRQLQQTPGSGYYWPYSQPTIPADRGYDAIRAGIDTQNADKEWNALKQELGYWATTPYRNYTDQEIADRIDWGKYPTLKAMNDSVKTPDAQPIVMTAGTDYSPDAVYGAIWAARNGGGTSSMDLNIAYSTLGYGKGYQENKEIRDKLDENNPATYAPYSVGMTAEDLGVYFGVPEITQELIDSRRDEIMAGGDPTAIAMLNRAQGVVDYTRKLDDEKAAMDKQISDMIGGGHNDPDEIINAVYGNSAYQDLFDLDETITGSKKTQLMETGWAVDYRKADVEAEIRSRCERKQEASDAFVTGSYTAAQQPAVQQHRTNLGNAAAAIDAHGTEAEKTAVRSGVSGTDASAAFVNKWVLQPIQDKFHKIGEDGMNRLVREYYDDIGTAEKFNAIDERAAKARDERNNIANAVTATLGSIRDAGGFATDEEADALIGSVGCLKPGDTTLLGLFGGSGVTGADIQQNVATHANKVIQQINKYNMYIEKGNADKAEDALPALLSNAYACMRGTGMGDETPSSEYLHSEEGIQEAKNLLKLIEINNQTSGQVSEYLGQKARLDQATQERDAAFAEQQAAQPEREDFRRRQEQFLDKLAYGVLFYEANGDKADTKIYSAAELLPDIVKAPPEKEWASAAMYDDVRKYYVSEKGMTEEQAAKQAMSMAKNDVRDIEDKIKMVNAAFDALEAQGVQFSMDERKNLYDWEQEERRKIDEAYYYTLRDEPQFKAKATEMMEEVRNDTSGKYSSLARFLANAGKDMSGEIIQMNIDEGLRLLTDDKASIMDEDYKVLGGSWDEIKATMENLTEDEILTYFYVMATAPVNFIYSPGHVSGPDSATQRSNAAYRYMSTIMDPETGYMHKRNSDAIRKKAADFSNSGWAGQIIGTGASFGANLLSIVSETFGDSDNPYSWDYRFADLREGYREGAKEYLHKLFNNVEAVDTIYDALISSAGDSMIVGAAVTMGLDVLGSIAAASKTLSTVFNVAGNVADKLPRAVQGALKITGDFAHAVPMGLGAANSAYRDVMIRTHGDKEKAEKMALGTFLAETLTEAVTFSNMRGMYKAGEISGKDILGVIKSFLGDTVEEIAGESINEIVEFQMDKIIMDDSEWQQTFDYYKSLGYSDEYCTDMADNQMWKNVAQTVISTLISTGATETVSHAAGSINAAQTGRSIKEKGDSTVTALAELELKQKDGENGKLARKVIDAVSSGKTVSSKDVGRLAQGLLESNSKAVRAATWGLINSSGSAGAAFSGSEAASAGAAAAIAPAAEQVQQQAQQRTEELADMFQNGPAAAETEAQMAPEGAEAATTGAAAAAQTAAAPAMAAAADTEAASAQTAADAAQEAAATAAEAARTAPATQSRKKAEQEAKFAERRQNFNDRLVKDIAAITEAEADTENVGTATSNIGWVLQSGSYGTSNVDPNAALAAAQTIVGGVFGGDTKAAATMMRGLVRDSGSAAGDVKKAVIWASMTDGKSRRVMDMMAERAKNGIVPSYDDGFLIRQAMENDQKGPDAQRLQENYAAAVSANRTANKVSDHIQNGELAAATKGEKTALDNAKKTVKNAEEIVDQANREVEAKSKNLLASGSEFLQNPDPSGETRTAFQNARAAKVGAVNQQTQAQRGLTNARETEAEAQKKLDAKEEEALNGFRTEAEAEKAQEDQQAAEEQQYKQGLVDNGIIQRETDETEGGDPFASNEEMEARERAHFAYDENAGTVSFVGEADEATEKVLTDAGFMKQTVANPDTGEQGTYFVADRNAVSVDTLKGLNDAMNMQEDQRKEEQAAKEKALNDQEVAEEQKEYSEEEQKIRERLMKSGYSGEGLERQTKRLMEYAETRKRSKVDTTAKLSDKGADKFLRKLSRVSGLKIKMADLGDPIRRRGFVTDRYSITLNSNITIAEALAGAAEHEATHGAETTKAYGNYASYVIQQEYGGEDTEAYKEAIRREIKNAAMIGETMTPERARYELVADYARNHLATKQYARMVTSFGIGGKVLESVRHAITMLTGYNLGPGGRAEYVKYRTAAKMLNEALLERAEQIKAGYAGHTGLIQNSINGWANATGLTLEVTDDENRVYKLYNNGKEIKPGEYTADMVIGSPVGNLIGMAGESRASLLDARLEKGKITPEEYSRQIGEIVKTANQQRQYVADIVNMIGQYQDAAMVWELAGSLAFSALKTNGDPQYSDSYDFGTICTKTQAILNAISQTQVDLGRGLTKEEIDGIVYEEVGKGVQDEKGKWKHGATPCPPCYVYATWVNKPARLEMVRKFQNEMGGWTNEQINEFMNRPDPEGKTKSETDKLVTENNSRKLWISTCLADQVTDKETGEKSWTRKDNPSICPDDILLDLRRSGEMATKYAGTWTFMQKGGNAQGKAIAPYSDARLGESIVAKAIGAGEANARLLEDQRNEGNTDYIPQFMNPFLLTDEDSQQKAKEYFDKAIKKVKAQNLKGGQRWQSWSDFRAEWGSDYLMEMITMQALGAQVQTYTKVAEAIDLLASAGFEVNMSLMPYGDGFWHNEDGSIKIDEDGNMMLRFSPVTGFNPDAADGFAKKYGKKGNVQPMVVGISDEHIKAALAGDFITFVIPFHGSGGSVARLQHLMSLLHEQMDTGNDYTKAQSDTFKSGKTNTNPNWALREAILTGNYDSLRQDQKDAIDNNPYLLKLYEDRYINEDSEAYGVFFSRSEAQQIYPYEYWDTNTTLATADKNSQRFIDYCELLGVIPRFSGLTKKDGTEYGNFSGRRVDADGNVTYNPVKGYWKLLIDRSMYNRVYDENGKIIPEQCTYHKPQAVSTADIQVGAMPMAANNTVGHSDDETRQITERIIQRIQMTSGQNQAAGSVADMQQNKQVTEAAMYQGADVQDSSLGGISEAEADQLPASIGMETPADRIIRQDSSLGDLSNEEMDMILYETGMLTADDAPYSNLPANPAAGSPIPPAGPGTNVGNYNGENGAAQRQFGSKTAQESDALHQSVKDYLFQNSSYTPDSNQAQIDRAVDWVQSKADERDPDGYYNALDEVTRDDFDYRSADGQARMLTVMSMAALKAESGDRGALNDEQRIADAYNRQGTDLGRMLQARKIFRLMTPLGRRSVLQGMMDTINEQYGRKGKDTRVHLSEETLKLAEGARTEEDFDKVRKMAEKELAEQMPANWKEKLVGWRMLSMLGNPRTHVRNVLGNLLFMPVVGIKNKVAAAGELFLDKDQRTKTLGFASKEARAFAKNYVNEIHDLLTGEAKYKDGSGVQQERKIWGQGKGIISKTAGKALQWAYDKNGKALEFEDWVFLKRHFQNAMSGYMTARGLKAADMKGKTLEDAAQYAIQEAQKATYRDANGVASALSNIKNPTLRFLTNAVLPFKKTPANILKRGLEYSPAGLIKSLTLDAHHLRQYQDYQNGKLDMLPDKAISPSQWIDKVSSGLTGSAITAAGFALAALGFVKAGFGDDDEDEFDKLRGEQEYSLQFTIGGQEVSYTIDWAAPACMPFFVGASLFDSMDKDAEASGKELDISGVISSILSVTEPVWNLSMLDGVNRTMTSAKYSGDNPMEQLGLSILANYGTSYVPTLSGQIARTIDTTRRKNFIPSGGNVIDQVFGSAREQIENKLPFLSKSNIPYRNAWGEEDTSDRLYAAIENFVSPGYGNIIEDDPVLDELERLYTSVKGDSRSAMLPKMPQKTVNRTADFGGEKIILNDQQYDQLVVERGQTAKRLISDLMGRAEYILADDETKADMISDLWAYSTQRANSIVSGGTSNKDNWVAAAEKNGDPVDKTIERAISRNMKAYKDGYRQAMYDALDAGNTEEALTSIEALRRAGSEDKTIKSGITSRYKPLYVAAYKADDGQTMLEIEEALEALDMNYTQKSFTSWLKGADDADEDEEEETSFDTRWLNRDADNTSGAIGGLRIASNGVTRLPQSARNQTSDPTGQYGKGNIDLNNRILVMNEDGSYSTELSFSFYDEDSGKEVLIPTVINGKIVSEDEAIEHYYQTGEYLGMFDTPEEADEYAEMLHNRQEWYYNL